MKFKKQEQTGATQRFIVRDHRTELFNQFLTLATSVMKLIRKLVKWKYMQEICHCVRHVAEAKPFCQTSFVPVTRTEVLMWENYHPCCLDLGC